MVVCVVQLYPRWVLGESVVYEAKMIIDPWNTSSLNVKPLEWKGKL